MDNKRQTEKSALMQSKINHTINSTPINFEPREALRRKDGQNHPGMFAASGTPLRLCGLCG